MAQVPEQLDYNEIASNIITEYEKGNLTKFGVINNLRRVGFRMDYAISLGSSLKENREIVAWQHRGRRFGQKEFGSWREGRNQSFDTVEGDKFEERPLYAI